ncbi:MAG: serine protease [Acidimicrobiia bacterium]|nr:serine protease [Acidimicrobiia bacterium]MBV9040006.1 serine protease [Acidimicrobiia bacterium]
MMRREGLSLAVLIGVLLVAFAGVAGLAPAHSAGTPTPAWAPAATAGIHPGVQTTTQGSQCTANFIYFDSTNVYIGQAAHCSGTGGNTATNGCTSTTLPVGTQVNVEGASKPGTMVYNSWATMQSQGEKDANACQYNDLALVQLDSADVGNVNPSVPHWGGPSGLAGGTSFLGQVYTYGNSSLRPIPQLSPKTGLSLGSDSGGWNQTVYTVTPGIPGDSGSGFLNSNGQAFGVLSTVQLLPLAGANGVGSLGLELDYLHSHVPALAGVQLANGTQPFKAGLPL